MKKYIITSLFIIVFILSVAFASWWNPFSWGIFKGLFKTKIEQPIIISMSKINTFSSTEEKEKLSKIDQVVENNQPKPQIQNPNPAVTEIWQELEARFFTEANQKGWTSLIITSASGEKRYYRKEDNQWIRKNSETEATQPYQSAQFQISPPTQKQIDQLMDFCTLDQTTQNICTKDNGLFVNSFYTNIAFRTLVDQDLTNFYQKLSEQQKKAREQEILAQKRQLECLSQNPYTEEELKFMSPQQQQYTREIRCNTLTPQSDLNYKLYQQQEYQECLIDNIYSSYQKSCSYLKPIFY